MTVGDLIARLESEVRHNPSVAKRQVKEAAAILRELRRPGARDESHKLRPTGAAARHRLVEARCNLGTGDPLDGLASGVLIPATAGLR